MENSCVKHKCEDTPKYAEYILEGAVPEKHRRLPRTEISDILGMNIIGCYNKIPHVI